MNETKVERISADEAMRRGYVWMRAGWNHKENAPVICPIGTLKGLCANGLSVAGLDAIKTLLKSGELPGEGA